MKNLRFLKVEIQEKLTLIVLENTAKLLLNHKPFRMDFSMYDEIVLSVNSANLLKFEHYRLKVIFESFYENFRVWVWKE